MAVLVTGGAGYIGSHTCVELLEAGYDIIVADNFANSKVEALRRVSELTGKGVLIYPIDLLKEEALERVFQDHSIEAVIHFAGLKAVGESVQFPLRYYYYNIMSTIHLCNMMKKYGVERLVFSSSATVYGLPDAVPIPETAPLQAVNPYGRTKLFIEELLRDEAHADPSWRIALLRYFNPIGAHKSGRIGENPNGVPNNLMPFLTEVAVGRRPCLHIFGNQYPTPDGTGIRDYLHVMDLAKGHVKALESLQAKAGIEAYNLGTGGGYSVLEVISAFERATGIPISTTITPPRPGDAAICYADPTKAWKLLGWKAERGIEEMCQDAWRWQKANPNGYLDKELLLEREHVPHFFVKSGDFLWRNEGIRSNVTIDHH